jgi:hypothetical protein
MSAGRRYLFPDTTYTEGETINAKDSKDYGNACFDYDRGEHRVPGCEVWMVPRDGRLLLRIGIPLHIDVVGNACSLVDFHSLMFVR